MVGVIDVGGGTRGIFGAGVFDFCMDHEIRFDHAIGVSAGSANAASYLAGQRGRNLRFYDNYAFRREYMGMNLFLHTGEYISLDYIYSTLSNSDGEDPLGYEKLMENAADLEIVTTDAQSGKVVYFQKNCMAQDNYDCIKASCAVPIACRPYRIAGRPYYDGGLSDPIPYKRALDQGCDKLVVVLTRPKTQLLTPDRDRKLAALIRRKYPKAAQRLAQRSSVYNESLRDILQLEREGKVLIIAPDDIGEMRTLTQDHAALRKLYEKGYQEAEKIPEFLSA